MAKILALLVLLIALGGGGAAGYVLRPPPPEADADAQPPEPEAVTPSTVVTFDRTFVVPVLRGGRAWSHVVLALGIESDRLPSEVVHNREPVLRDSLNEALFLHGSLGDFDGDFTEPMAMSRLRTRLNEAASRALDDDTARVLIVSVVRQQS
ncbi:MAG: flagellar basal body-associated protein FliL [Pseudomonadota bacterium]